MEPNTVIVDACLVITFGNANALNVVTGLRQHRVAVGKIAAGEVTRPPAIDQLNGRVADGSLQVVGVNVEDEDEQAAWARFDAMPAFRGRGDAEVLALAASRGWIVGSDDRAVTRGAASELGPSRIAGTLDFLRWGVAEQRLTVREGTALLGALDSGAAITRRIVAAGLTPDAVLAGND